MKFKLIATLICWLLVQVIYCQVVDDSDLALSFENRNVIYTEAFIINPSKYDFGYPSINYERYSCCIPGLSMKVGFSSDFNSHLAVPFSINYLTHLKSKHHIEVGMGAILTYQENKDEYYNAINAFAIFLPLMYRFQQQKGIFYRAGINSCFGKSYLLIPSLSMGIKF